MKETKKQLAARLISRGGPLWRALQHAYYTPRNAVRGVYRRLSKNGIFFDEQELGMASNIPILKITKTIEMFKPKTVLDLGCGVGKTLDFFHDHGIQVEGVEGSQLAIDKANRPSSITKRNLNNELNLGRKFDLVWCFEVVEHIHPDYVENLMKTFSNHSDRIVISAARPGQGGEGHFNEQPPEYWINKFSDQDFLYDEVATSVLRAVDEKFSQNIIVFYRLKAATFTL